MTTNGEVILRGCRILRPEFTTWNRLLDARDFLRDQVTLKLGEQINLIEGNPEAVDTVRAWMQVSDRHQVTRREMFNYMKHVHEASMWLDNWKMVLHIYPIAEPNFILIRIESGAILDKWFELFIDPDTYDMQYEHVSYPSGDDEADEAFEMMWTMYMTLIPHPYRLTVCDDLQEFASACV